MLIGPAGSRSNRLLASLFGLVFLGLGVALLRAGQQKNAVFLSGPLGPTAGVVLIVCASVFFFYSLRGTRR